MSEVNMMVGNIGSGKSTIAKKLAINGNIVVNMDSITQMISGGNYDMYDIKKKKIYDNTEEIIIRSALENNFDLTIDRTNMDKKRRAKYINIIKEYNAIINVYNFGPGTGENLKRRENNPRGVSNERWRMVWAKMKKDYEQPSLDEGIDNIIDMKNPDYHFIAVDFDGTIVENKFPEIGKLITGDVAKTLKQKDMVKYIKDKWNESLQNIIIIWTCRNNNYLLKMQEFLRKNKIPFDFINENPYFLNDRPRKIFSHEYLDDRNNSIYN